ncbi:MAG: alpha-mannosidase [Planctomycetes bacterium]|nr:alpha-mannosidase [Planctomycetota bacterium]
MLCYTPAMIGISDRDFAALRFEAFGNEVLAPAVHPLRAPLQVEVFQTPERVTLALAEQAAYTPVAPGFRWGPAWSTAWFKVRGQVPPEMAGWPVALRFSSGTEALLWWQGARKQGFDENRDTCLLLPCAQGGADIECLIEAACNAPLGVTMFWWHHPELMRRWSEERPGRLECCELVAVDPVLWRFREQYDFARRLALCLPESSARANELIRGLREITNLMPAADPRRGLERAAPLLEALLAGRGGAPATTCVAVGHAHIDTAWLWPIGETRRKIQRSWANVLELMERFPGLYFLASQAQHYAFCEEDAPALFARVRERVAEGRWEAGGAMWVESDANCPSGEALVRQILHGASYWRDRFGERGRQRFLYLPDTFGFPASLPQIMALAGLDTFITDKMAWCERDDFPHVTFRWRGIDGSEVLAHLTPGMNYNSSLQPEELRKGEDHIVRKDDSPIAANPLFIPRWLQPFGFGDGGGGPTAESALRAEVAAQVAGLPRVEQGRVDEFCTALHAARDAARAESGRDLAVWDGELYMEGHRGTLTTQGWLKRANARAERRLRALEALLAAAPESATARALLPRLDRLWKTVLLHQFHDILPGSSITAVYDDARAAYAHLEEELQDALASAARALAAEAGEENASFLVFNPCSHSRSGVARLGGRFALIEDLPALSAAFLGAANAREAEGGAAVSVGRRTLANAHLSLTLDDAGRIAELREKAAPLAVNAVFPGGALCPLNQLTRGALEVLRRFRSSRIVERYVLDAGARRVEIEWRIDWREERTVLRTLNAANVRARHWTSGIQFGHLLRATHQNTSWDEARFEVPGQRWMDLSQPGLGLALFDDGKYGRSCLGNVLGLTLLRSPNFPDPTADRGEHEFRLGLMPHGGDWRAAHVPRQADELAEPPIVLPLRDAAPPGAPDPAGASEPTRRAPFRLAVREGGDAEIACFKPAENGAGLILRLVERHGGLTRLRLNWNLPVAALEHWPESRATAVTLSPFEILTLKIGLAPPEQSPA